MALLRGNKGSRKLVGKGERLVTLLRSHSDPSLTDGSNLRMTFLCDVVGSRKLVEEGRSKLALLRRIDDPPLTGGSVFRIAFLR